MHIGFYSAAWPPGRDASGIVTYTAEMKAGLEAIGHRVTVLAPPPEQAPTSLAGRIVAAAKRRWRDLRPDDPACFPAGGRQLAREFARHHRADPFDVVEMEETFGWSRFVQQALDVPVVTRLHGPHFLGKDRHEDPVAAARSDRREAAEEQAIAAARGLTSPSPRLLAATLRHYGLDGSHARAIFNPVASVAEADRWRLDETDPDLLLCVGRFDWRKGADIVLQAFARVAAARPAAKLVMVGPEHGLQLVAGAHLGFEDYCRAHLPESVAARIRFLGKQPPAAIAALRRQARVTVVGSRFETFSYAAAEAMAVGSPLVGTDIFGVGELIADGESGWRVPSEDPAALADAIGRALADPAACARRGANGWRRARALLDPVTIAEQTADYYTALIRAPAAAAAPRRH